MENCYNNNSKNYKAHSVKEKGIMANCITLNQTSYHGAGAIQSIPDEEKAHGLTKAFVCSDPDLIKFGVTKKDSSGSGRGNLWCRKNSGTDTKDYRSFSKKKR